MIKEGNKISFDRFISILSIVIALIAFVDTSIQTEKNNVQFEENRKASDSLFKVQLSHAQKLNDLLLLNSNKLNDSLIIELNKIQDINTTLTESAKNQLETTKENLKLTTQSLQDYIIETRANIKLSKTIISSSDSITDDEFRIFITENIDNVGKREATKFELRNAIIHYDGKVDMSLDNSNLTSIFPNEAKKMIGSFVLTKEQYDGFFYWRQLIYFDERLNKLINRSDYFDYNKASKEKLDFYYASPFQKDFIRKKIDAELAKKGLILTVD